MASPFRIFRWLASALDNACQESLDLTGYEAHIERHFDINLHDADAAGIKTLGDLRDYICHQCATCGKALSPEQIWVDMRRITASEFGVDENELHEKIRYVEDLNC